MLIKNKNTGPRSKPINRYDTYDLKQALLSNGANFSTKRKLNWTGDGTCISKEIKKVQRLIKNEIAEKDRGDERKHMIN